MSSKLSKLLLLQPSAIDKINQMSKTNNEYLEKFLLPIYTDKNLNTTEKWYKISHEFQKYITLQRKDIRPIRSTENQLNIYANDQQKIEKNENLPDNIEKEELANTDKYASISETDVFPVNEFNAIDFDSNCQNNSSIICNTNKIEDYDLPNLKSSPMPSKIISAATSARKLKDRKPNYDNMKIVRKGDSVFTVFDDNNLEVDDSCEEKVRKGSISRVSPVITRSKTTDSSIKKLAKDGRTGASSSSTRRHHAALRWDALED